MSDIIIKLRMLKFFFPCSLRQWWDGVWKVDLDTLVCCIPSMQNPCGCYGATYRDNLKYALRSKS